MHRSFWTTWGLCLLLFLATVLNYLNRQTLSILAPALQQQMHMDNEALGWLFAAFYYSYTLSQFAVGPVLDSFNIRWLLCLGGVRVVFGLGTDGARDRVRESVGISIVARRNGIRQLARRTADRGPGLSAGGAAAGERNLYQRHQRGLPDRTRAGAGN